MEEKRQRRQEEGRERVLEQEPTPVQARPVPPPMPPKQQITVTRALARAQVGVAGSAQGFARAVLALVSQPDGSSSAELAALATEAAGYLQAVLKAAAVRRTATRSVTPEWQAETRTSFCLLGELPRTPAVDDALVEGCAVTRAAISAEQVPGFMAECRERAGGRADRLAWAGVAEDLKIAASVGDRSHCR